MSAYYFLTIRAKLDDSLRKAQKMNIEYLREYIIVASQLSYSAASRELFISRSALSKHLLSLEENVGCQLLVREANGIQLTAAGESFLTDARTVVNEYETAVSNARRLSETGKPVLRVGYLHNATAYYIREILNHFEDLLEHCEIEFGVYRHEELKRKLMEKKIDVALDMDLGYGVDASIVRHPIYSDECCVAVRRDHPWASRESISTTDLCESPLLLPSPSVIPDLFAFYCKPLANLNRKTKNDLYYNDVESMFMLLQSKNIAAITSMHHKHFVGDRMEFIPLSDCTSSYNISALYLASNTNKALDPFTSSLSSISHIPKK